jgi:hypothetical protein
MRAVEHALGALVGLGATVPAGHATRLPLSAATESGAGWSPGALPAAAALLLLRLDVAAAPTASDAGVPGGARTTTATLSCDAHPPLRLVNDAPSPLALRLRRMPVLPPRFAAWVNAQLQPLEPLVAELQASLSGAVQCALGRVSAPHEREALELRCARAKLALAMAMEACLDGAHGGAGGGGTDAAPEPLARHPLLCCSYVHTPSAAVLLPPFSSCDWDWSCLAEWRQYLPQASLRVALPLAVGAAPRTSAAWQYLDVPVLQAVPAFPAAWSAQPANATELRGQVEAGLLGDGGAAAVPGGLAAASSFSSASLTPSERSCEPPAVRHLHQLAQVAVLSLPPHPVATTPQPPRLLQHQQQQHQQLQLQALPWSEPAWLDHH